MNVQDHLQWHRNKEFRGDYNQTKFERNCFVSTQIQANIRLNCLNVVSNFILISSELSEEINQTNVFLLTLKPSAEVKITESSIKCYRSIVPVSMADINESVFKKNCKNVKCSCQTKRPDGQTKKNKKKPNPPPPPPPSIQRKTCFMDKTVYQLFISLVTDSIQLPLEASDGQIHQDIKFK